MTHTGKKRKNRPESDKNRVSSEKKPGALTYRSYRALLYQKTFKNARHF